SIVDITDVCGVNSQSWPPVGMVQTIAAFDQQRGKIEAALALAPRHKLAEVTLKTPIPWPNKVIAFPVNYHDHGKEMQADYRATHQGFFLKPASSLSGANEPVVLPNTPSREIHHECELAIVIGKQGKD